MRAAIDEQLAWYGNSVTTISMRPFLFSSIVAVARILTLPRPVRYASIMPARPKIDPPVGKSGPLTNSIKSSMEAAGLSSK